MLDRYLFRGKRIANGKWIYGGICEQSQKENVCIVQKDRNNYNGVSVTEVVIETVGQCTGLNDKNLIDVFVGDIAEDEHGREWVIEHRYGGFVLINRIYHGQENNDLIWECLSDPQTASFFETQCKVIGNIHDQD